MNRATAKFIVENLTQLHNIIMCGGIGTFVKIGGDNPDSIVIDSDIVEHYMNILPTIRAFADGEDVQYYCKVNSAWIHITHPSFDKKYPYRVKPEPREFYMVKSKASGAVHQVYEVGTSFPLDKGRFEYIKVREIIE